MTQTLDERKVNNGEIAVGIDLTDKYTQLSYSFIEGDNVETLSTTVGTQNYMIPTALFKRGEVNQWFAGKDAVSHKDDEGYFVDNLLSIALEGVDVTIGEETFKAHALLALFIKRTLSLINTVSNINKISSLMITVNELNNDMVEALNRAVASLGLKNATVSYQSHMESFYYYMIYQPADLWKQDVLVLHADGITLKTYRMECNKNTTPVVAFIDEREYPIPEMELVDGKVDPAKASTADLSLYNFSTRVMVDRNFSAVYLIGDTFKEQWYERTSKELLRRARVFQGNNLFSKGAACAAKNKIASTVLSEGYVFLGNDKLKSNIGMNVTKRGENTYLALLDAGINWFEAVKEYDLILNQGNRISFVITPLTGRNPKVVDITLDDFPKRPPKTSRVHLSLRMTSERQLSVNIKDLGFGELFPASDTQWDEVIDV